MYFSANNILLMCYCKHALYRIVTYFFPSCQRCIKIKYEQPDRAQMIKKNNWLAFGYYKILFFVSLSHRSIICLSLSASENKWSSPHSYMYITIFCATLSNCCFNNRVIITTEANRISSAPAFRHSFVTWSGCYVVFIPLPVIRKNSYFLTLWWWFQRLTGL